MLELQLCAVPAKSEITWQGQYSNEIVDETSLQQKYFSMQISCMELKSVKP
jgi:hypothetical protein